MLLKLGRVTDGKIVSTEWYPSTRFAIAMMWTPEELGRVVEAFQQHGPNGLCLLGPPPAVAHDATQPYPWITADWNDFLATLPPSENPRVYAQVRNVGKLVLPAGVKL